MDKKRVIYQLIAIVFIIILGSLTIGKSIMQEKQSDLLSFILLHFLAYLFFIIMPIEIIFPYYLDEGYSAIALVMLAVGIAMIAQIIDYFIGYTVDADKLISRSIGQKRFDKLSRELDNYGSRFIFLFNALPLSSPIIVLVSG